MDSRAGQGRDERSAFLICFFLGLAVGGKDEGIQNPISEHLRVHVSKLLHRKGGLSRLLVQKARLGRRAYVPKVHTELVEFLGYRTRGVPAHGKQAACLFAVDSCKYES